MTEYLSIIICLFLIEYYYFGKFGRFFRVSGSGKNKKGIFIVSGTLDTVESVLKLCFHYDHRNRFQGPSPQTKTILSRRGRRDAAAKVRFQMYLFHDRVCLNTTVI